MTGDVAEGPLGRAVVDAVALPRHALDDARLLEYPAVAVVLVLPSHVGVHDRARSPRLLRQQTFQHLLLLRHVRRPRYAPRDDLLAAEVVRRGEVGLAPRSPELGDVSADLLPGPVGREVPVQDVLERPADEALERVVPVVVALAPDAAADAHLAHDPQHGLVGHHRALLGAQGHGDLPVSAAVGRAGEHLGYLPPQFRPRRPRRVRAGAVVGRPREPSGRQ